MGSINKQYIKKIQDDICPLCDNKMVPMNIDYEDGWDGFHYKCNNCNPNIVIGFSGSLLANEKYGKIIQEDTLKNYLRIKVSNCSKGKVELQTKDVPD